MVESEAPFLNNIILCTLQKPIIDVPLTFLEEGIDNKEESIADDPQEDSLWEMEGIVFERNQEANNQIRLAQLFYNLYPSEFSY